MLESPSKRRKLDNPAPGDLVRIDNNETTSTTVDAAAPPQQHQQLPTTPTTAGRRRASYLSPTKSYLARSHPQLVPRSSTRRAAAATVPETTTRGKALRDEILKKTSAASAASAAVEAATPRREEAGKTDSRPADENLQTENADADAVAESKEGGDVVTMTTAAAHVPVVAPRSPLRERPQQPSRSSPRRFRPSHGWEDAPLPTPVMVPTLVPKSAAAAAPLTTDTGASRPTSQHTNEEPELPPTPVQLGLSTAPARPRGLASSSSPRGSKSGSGRHRRRLRDGSRVGTSSPLKPKAPVPSNSNDDDQDVGSDHDEEVREALESARDDVHEAGAEMDEGPVQQEKQSTLESLKDQLQKLRRDNARLEAMAEHDGEMADDESLAFLRQTASQDVGSHNPTETQTSTSTPAHLTLFAPGNLQLTSRTETRAVQVQGSQARRVKVVHFLTVAAPPPWPPDFLGCTVQVTVEAEDVRVEDVQLMTNRKTAIYKWAHDRLRHPLHSLDVAGLVWGLGRWFAAAVERARVWDRLDRRYNNQSLPATELTHGPLVKPTDTVRLSRYLHQTQIRIQASSSGQRRQAVLLSWNINLDWTGGGVRSDVDVAVTGVTPTARVGLKRVFAGLLPSRGVAGAFEGVWTLMHDSAAASEDSGKTLLATQKGRKRKHGVVA